MEVVVMESVGSSSDLCTQRTPRRGGHREGAPRRGTAKGGAGDRRKDRQTHKQSRAREPGDAVNVTAFKDG